MDQPDLGQYQLTCSRPPSEKTSPGASHLPPQVRPRQTTAGNNTLQNRQKYRIRRLAALCPCCLAEPEDQLHFIQCKANTTRQRALADMLKSLTETDQHPFCISIAAGLDRFLSHPTEKVEIPYEKLEMRYHEDIRHALEDQQRISWIHLLCGFTSLSWLHLASAKSLDPTTFDTKRGEHRIQLLLQALHTFTRAIWLGRNDALHRTKETTDAIKYTADSSEIRHYLDNPTLLPAEDRHYCSSNNLAKLLCSRPSVRRRWLQCVRTARSNMIKHGKSQLTLTKYYALDTNHTVTERQPQTAPVLAHTVTTNPRTQTTQQCMTSFFPGLPPPAD